MFNVKEILQQVILSEAPQPHYWKGEHKENLVLQCGEGINPHCMGTQAWTLRSFWFFLEVGSQSMGVQDIFMEVIGSLADQ